MRGFNPLDDVAYPNFNKDCKLYELDIDVSSRLSYHLSRTVKGNGEVYMSPVANNVDPKTILNELDSIVEINGKKLNPTLTELELSQRSKFGPRSIAKPWSERIKDIDEHFDSSNTVGNLRAIPSISKLRPLTLSNALLELKNSTNSGLPYFTKKGKVKTRVLEKFDQLISKEYPCILFTRTQEGMKTRSVWGYPIADTLNEMRFYSPLLQYQKSIPYRSALLSPDNVNQSITNMLIKASTRPDMSLVSIDFSAYDASVKSELQMRSFDYIRGLFQSDFSDDLNFISRRFESIPIWTPDGIRRGNHGVPSGSTFTNEVDSIAQATIAKTVTSILESDFQIQGDDGAYLLLDNAIDELYNSFTDYGLTVNRDKSYQSKNYVIYLQNLYHMDYIKNGKISGIYPIYRALNRIIYQERWQDFEDYDISGKDYYSIRTISILENCKHHPLFEDLVKLIVKYDKYSLDFDDQGLRKYVLMLNQTEGKDMILKHQYGTDPTGIKNFESFKLIKKLVKGSG